MSAVSGSLELKMLLKLVGALDLSAPTDELSYSKRITFAGGTGANQANEIFHDQRTLAASATENLDLSGALTDSFGASVVFLKVRALLIYASSGNTNDVLVGGAASNGFIAPFGDATDIVKVKPGGILLMTAPDANGLAVVAATGDILKIANGSSGTGVTYDVVIVGS